MKKITVLIVILTSLFLQSCVVEPVPVVNNTNNNPLSEVFEYSNVNFRNSNNFSIFLDFPYTIYTSDMVLVYRLSGYNGADVWTQLPETYYFNDGTLDFGFISNATRYDVNVSMMGYDLADVSTNYRLNQVLRVVVIPANIGNKAAVDFTNYKEVITHFKIDESKIYKIKI